MHRPFFDSVTPLIKSCSKNGVSTLCGRFLDKYVERFLSTNCISIQSCQTFCIFWLVHCIYALILVTFLYSMKDFISLIKTVSINICKIFQPFREEKEGEGEIDVTISVAKAEENLDKISHFTMSGFFNLLASSYQIKQLMSVNVQYNQYKNLNGFSFITSTSNFFNLEVVEITYYSYYTMSK